MAQEERAIELHQLSSYDARFNSTSTPNSELNNGYTSAQDTASLGPNFEDPNEQTSTAIPPADGGRAAWLFLAGSFMLEALVWGFPFTFGIFQDYYSTHEPFSSQGSVAIIGTTSTGLMYLGAPIFFSILLRFPRIQRLSTAVGLVVMCLALAASSFAQTTGQLIATQGVLYAIGGDMAYCPAILQLDQWFVRRKGLAFGVMVAGTGLAGFALPFAMRWALTAFGFRVVLRAWAVALFVLTAPLLAFVKPRLPSVPASKLELRFLFNPAFVLLQAANVVEAFGFFLPSVYLPSFASSLGAAEYPSALTVVLFNMASVIGCVAMGHLIDRWHVATCITFSAVGSALSVLLLWGLSGGIAQVYVFCIFYGLFAGSFSSTWPGIMRLMASKVARTDPGMVYAWLAAGRGVGNVVSGPLSEALLKGAPWEGTAKLGYGTGYGPLILFTGISALLSSVTIFGRASPRIFALPSS